MNNDWTQALAERDAEIARLNRLLQAAQEEIRALKHNIIKSNERNIILQAEIESLTERGDKHHEEALGERSMRILAEAEIERLRASAEDAVAAADTIMLQVCADFDEGRSVCLTKALRYGIASVITTEKAAAEERGRQAERERASDALKRRYEIENDNRRMLGLLRSLSNSDADAKKIASDILVKYDENRVWVTGKHSIGDVARAITFARSCARQAGVREGIEKVLGTVKHYPHASVREVIPTIRSLLPATPKEG